MQYARMHGCELACGTSSKQASILVVSVRVRQLVRQLVYIQPPVSGNYSQIEMSVTPYELSRDRKKKRRR